MTLADMIQAVLWPWVVFSAVAFCYSGFRLWLKRDATSVKDLKHQLGELERDWTHKFEHEKEQNERRIGAIERVLNAKAQSEGRNPLGAHYSTRGGA